MNHEVNAILQQPDVKDKMAAAFMEPAGGTPADLAAFMRRERDVMTPVIKRSGATID